jgi:hypothetical protein
MVIERCSVLITARRRTRRKKRVRRKKKKEKEKKKETTTTTKKTRGLYIRGNLSPPWNIQYWKVKARRRDYRVNGRRQILEQTKKTRKVNLLLP